MLSFLDPEVFNLVGSLLALSHQGQGFKYNLRAFRIVLPPLDFQSLELCSMID